MKLLSIFVLVCVCASTSSDAGEGIDFNAIRGMAEEGGTDAVLRCRVAKNQDRFDESLAQARWKGRDKPRIDWSSHAAVIVAPQMYQENYRPAVLSVSQQQKTVLVRWDFAKERPDVQPEIRVGSISSHLSTEIGPEVLVVVVSRGALNDKKVVCRGPTKA